MATHEPTSQADVDTIAMLSTRVSPGLRKRLKRYSVESGKSMQETVKPATPPPPEAGGPPSPSPPPRGRPPPPPPPPPPPKEPPPPPAGAVHPCPEAASAGRRG